MIHVKIMDVSYENQTGGRPDSSSEYHGHPLQTVYHSHLSLTVGLNLRTQSFNKEFCPQHSTNLTTWQWVKLSLGKEPDTLYVCMLL